MENKLTIYNTLSRKKELFEPINPPFVGLYVCGPTVYGDAHLGHARPAITFDLLFRYLKFMGYRVRYVRNITDVGHLVNDADEGEDKIAKKAKLEQLEPMEVVQFYSNRYHKNMEQLNTLPPSIEPHASGHIIEQQELIKQIIENGFAYESEGNIYFDVERYNQKYHYGKLSGRKIDELFANTRELSGQQEKRNPFDFALWKKASPEHIMRWPSPWGVGNPYSVVLFDEIEKAHPDVFNILLQILEDGILTDAQGRRVDFRNAVIIMTSNIGARMITETKNLGFGSSENAMKDDKEIKNDVMNELKKHFRPEFLNRIDDIIVFQKLSEDDIKLIASKMLEQLTERVKQLGINLVVTEEAIAEIANEGYEPVYGARPLRRAITTKIEHKLSEYLLSGKVKSGDTVVLSVADGAFTFNES